MFPAVLSRATNGHIRRILIVLLATVTLLATLVIVPAGAVDENAQADASEVTTTTVAADPNEQSPVAVPEETTTTVAAEPDDQSPVAAPVETTATSIPAETTTTTVAAEPAVQAPVVVPPVTTTTVPNQAPAAVAQSFTVTSDDPVMEPTFGLFGSPGYPNTDDNPDLGNSCGINVALVMDSSGSIDDGGSQDPIAVYAAYKAVLAGLAGTGSYATVVDYDSTATLKFPWAPIVTGNEFDYNYTSIIGGRTNWTSALQAIPTATRRPDLVIMFSDGNPNDGNGVTGAIPEANNLKNSTRGPAHILGVAIGSNINLNNFRSITDGSNSVVGPPPPITGSSIKSYDVISASFSELEGAMRELASALCDGQITVTKLVDGAPTDGWTFDATDHAQGTTGDDGAGSGQTTFAWRLVNPTTKQVKITETLQADHAFINYACDGGGPSGGPVSGTTLETSWLTVNQGESVNCTFNNTNQARLTLVKTVVNDDGGTLDQGDFPAFINGQTVQWDATTTLTVGAHTASETTQPGYTPSTWGGDCAADGSITLNPGDDKTCTITNDDIAPTLTLVKTVVNDDGGTLDQGDFPAFIDAQSVQWDAANTVSAGAHTASETSQPGYVASSWGGDCAANGSITLNPGDNKTCTITNDDAALSLTLVKRVVNDDGGTTEASAWTLTATGPTTFAGSGPSVSSPTPFNPGTYTLSESVIAGYEVDTDWDCTGDGVFDAAGNRITLGLGDTATCTIVNTDIAPTLTLVKTVVNDDGGTLDQGDFPAFINGQTVQWDATTTLTVGAHTASETTQPGYTPTTWGGDCAADGSITLNPGDTATCTITNNDQAAGIDIEKATNGEDADTATGPLVAAGDPIAWTYEVTNTGLTGLTNVTVTDDQGVAVSCGSSVLAVGQSMTCTASGTAIAGQYANLGSVTATATSGAPVSDEDLSHYYGVTGGIDIEKATNGEDADTATGPLVAVGGDVTWLYLVQATGNTPLDNVVVTDSQGVVPIFSPNSDTNGNGLLDPGEIWVYEATGIAVAGQYANIGTATGTDPLQAPVEDVDPSHYYGVTSGIDIEKATNGEDADTATGPLVTVGGDVTWTYEVTNTGNVPISDLAVTDDQAGVIPAYVGGDASTDGLLDPGEIWVYEATGVAVAGQYANVGAASGLDPLEAAVEDSDPSHYYGVESAIGIEKTGALGLGDDGIANPGDVITYQFEVTNEGNADLSGIAVDDLDLGGVNVTCPKTDLAVGESMTCTADYPISQEDINAGTIRNCALAAGLDPLEDGVSDEDCTDTTIPQTPTIDIEKATNGVDADTPEDAPVINVGDPVTWTYVVTNTGNVPLEGVSVDDSVLGAISCSEDTLAVGATMTCEALGVAELVAYVNIGTVTGSFGDTIVSDEDPSHYFGIAVAGTGQIGDTVWQDTNKNGIQDAGETGINGAKVTLKDADGAVIATATTAKGPWDGWYKFVGLDAGRYTVTLDTGSVSGSLTTAGSFTINLADGVEFLDADFGVADALPKTGLDTELLAIAALLMLGLGTILVLATRRRRDMA